MESTKGLQMVGNCKHVSNPIVKLHPIVCLQPLPQTRILEFALEWCPPYWPWCGMGLLIMILNSSSFLFRPNELWGIIIREVGREVSIHWLTKWSPWDLGQIFSKAAKTLIISHSLSRFRKNKRKWKIKGYKNFSSIKIKCEASLSVLSDYWTDGAALLDHSRPRIFLGKTVPVGPHA